jgi:hypothetical protein
MSTAPRIFLLNVTAVENLSHIRTQSMIFRVPVFDDSSWFLYQSLPSKRNIGVFCWFYICASKRKHRDYLYYFPQVHPPADHSMQQCHAAIVVGDVTSNSISSWCWLFLRPNYVFIQSVLFHWFLLAVIHRDFQGRNHFINSHEDCVRLAFEQTIHPYAPSLLIVMVAPFCFVFGSYGSSSRTAHDICWQHAFLRAVECIQFKPEWTASEFYSSGKSTCLSSCRACNWYWTRPHCLTQCQCWVSRYQQRWHRW